MTSERSRWCSVPRRSHCCQWPRHRCWRHPHPHRRARRATSTPRVPMRLPQRREEPVDLRCDVCWCACPRSNPHMNRAASPRIQLISRPSLSVPQKFADIDGGSLLSCRSTTRAGSINAHYPHREISCYISDNDLLISQCPPSGGAARGQRSTSSPTTQTTFATATKRFGLCKFGNHI